MILAVALGVALVSLSGGLAAAAGKKKKPAPPPPPEPPRIGPEYDLTPGFVVKPSDVALPSDVPPGEYRRIIRPFPNWTLICDENLAKKQRVCNIAQTILGPDGSTVFSWSLAAAQDGQPFMILRAPPSVGKERAIQLGFPDGTAPVAVPIEGCDATVCIAYLPVGPRIRAAVKKGVAVGISYESGDAGAGAVSFRAPFDGLSAALAAI